MISDALRALAACPNCALASTPDPPTLRAEGGVGALCCPRCGSRYPQAPEAGYLDLRPTAPVDGRETRYTADEVEFARALAFRSVGEPLLGAAVRDRWLRAWLPWRLGQRILDVGCGDGRFALWNGPSGAAVVGLDAAPFFADGAVERVDLVLGDVRALPFPSASFDAAYSIDVMEHLDAPGLARFFAEVARILRPGGAFYLYSNTRERSTLWPIIAFWSALSRLLRRRGIGDFQADDLRKSDHVKVLTTWDEVVAFAGARGLRVERVRFWNGVFQGLIDNVLVRAGERVLLRRGGGPAGGVAVVAADGGAGGVRRQVVGRRPAVRLVLRALTAMMQLDVVLFGRLRSGPFFALLRKDGPDPVARR